MDDLPYDFDDDGVDWDAALQVRAPGACAA